MERDQATRFVHDLLRLLLTKKGSDLFITADFPPAFKLDGRVLPVSNQPLTAQHTAELVRAIMNDRQAAEFEATKECNFAINPTGIGRFRVSAFVQQGKVGIVFRTIADRIPTVEELNLPPLINELAMAKRGIVMVVGATGSGKSTTLAAMIDIINQNLARHILTIEDPIEFVHRDKKSHISQREVGHHAASFAAALRVALREDPDVILVGEMRDLETMTLTLGAAETGTLVFATVHTNSASKTIDRIIDVFPANEQEHARLLLSTTLQAVISQQLMPTKDGKGRVVATEIMIANSAIKNMIREGRTYQIPSSIVSGAKEGMIAMDTSLKNLYQSGLITAETAYTMAVDKESFEKLLGSA